MPRIEQYLATVPGPAGILLLSELIFLDIHYRRLHGEGPQPADYIGRFADLHADWIVQAVASRATAQSRMQQKPRKADRMEQQPAEFYERVRQAYRELAVREPKRVVLIDGLRDPDEVESEIWKMLSSRFPNLNAHH